MAEDQHMKFHTDKIARERKVFLRTCTDHFFFFFFVAVAVEKTKQFIN